MGLSSKEVSSDGHGWNKALMQVAGSLELIPKPSSSVKRQSSSSSSPSPSPSPSLSSSSQQQKQQQSEPLKCPRCDSTNTKFCYYNNYNKSQPRHFCKTCKRHWTKGGTLRNVPIGGGRKNKRKMSNTISKAASKPTTAAAATTTAALISGISNAPMTIQPQQPRLSLPLGTVGGVDQKNLSEAFYQALGRHPPCSIPESSIAIKNNSINEGNHGIFLGSTLSLPPHNEQNLNFPYSTQLGSSFESNLCSISSIQSSSNIHNYTGDQANNSLEETMMNSLKTNMSSSLMGIMSSDHQHQQSFSMATNTNSVMGISTNSWGWDDFDKFVSVDEAELTMPWDEDIKP